MLVLARKLHQRIRIGDEIEVAIMAISGGRHVRVGIEAPPHVPIRRRELLAESHAAPAPHLAPIVYLACPYTHPESRVREVRFRSATEFAARLCRAGLVVFSPLSHSHPMTEFGLPRDYAFWQRMCETFVCAAAAMIVLTLDGWEQSVGVEAERRLAEQLGKPIWYVPFTAELPDNFAERLFHAART